MAEPLKQNMMDAVVARLKTIKKPTYSQNVGPTRVFDELIDFAVTEPTPSIFVSDGEESKQPDPSGQYRCEFPLLIQYVATKDRDWKKQARRMSNDLTVALSDDDNPITYADADGNTHELEVTEDGVATLESEGSDNVFFVLVGLTVTYWHDRGDQTKA